MNVEMETKYYSIEDAVKMLPLIRTYCRDIRHCYNRVEILTIKNRKLSNLTSMDSKKKEKIAKLREYIRGKIELYANRYKRWREELKKDFITVCSAQFGRVDVPVYCVAMEAVVLFCVTPETTQDDIEWHVEGETHEQGRPYFEKVY